MWIFEEILLVQQKFDYAKPEPFSQYAWNFINFNPIHASNFLKARQQTEISIA